MQCLEACKVWGLRLWLSANGCLPLGPVHLAARIAWVDQGKNLGSPVVVLGRKADRQIYRVRGWLVAQWYGHGRARIGRSFDVGSAIKGAKEAEIISPTQCAGSGGIGWAQQGNTPAVDVEDAGAGAVPSRDAEVGRPSFSSNELGTARGGRGIRERAGKFKVLVAHDIGNIRRECGRSTPPKWPQQL